MAISLRPATEEDLPLLSQMNKRLIEDEGSHNPMSLDELQQRMASFLYGNWHIRLIIEDGSAAGYALYQFQRDSYHPEQTEVYLRQFYIERERRGQRLGSRAFRQLACDCFPAGCTISLGVLVTNPVGQAFWASLGFQPYYTAMRIKNNAEQDPR